MKAKGVIRQLVRWSESRMYFYWRLRRRLMEFDFYKQITSTSSASTSAYVGAAATPSLKRTSFLQKFNEFILSNGGRNDTLQNDKSFVSFVNDNHVKISQFVTNQQLALQATYLSSVLHQCTTIASTASATSTNVNDDEAKVQILRNVLSGCLTKEDKDLLLAALR
jgi:hypothetical protein